jgi:undecaprenyl-diphosphatase
VSTKGKVASIAVLGLLAVASALWVDVPLARWIEANSTDFSRSIARVLQVAGESHWVLIYCVVVALVAWRSWRSVAHKHVAFFASVAASGIAANIIKVLVCRPRPPLLFSDGEVWPHLLAFKASYLWNSFPSGHATTGLSIAIAGSAAWPRLSWLMWTVGVAIALGRVAYTVHYLSDVIAGGMLGMVIAWPLTSGRWPVADGRLPMAGGRRPMANSD